MIKKNKNSLYLIIPSSSKGEPQSPKANLTYIYSHCVKYIISILSQIEVTQASEEKEKKSCWFYHPFLTQSHTESKRHAK